MKNRKLIKIRKEYYGYIDKKARHLGYLLTDKKPVSKLILDYIAELYEAAKLDQSYKNNNFESAYHNPITSDLEFLIARTLIHYSNRNKLNWKIYLRRQVGKTAPDIRIDLNGKTLVILEIKAKAGWLQPVFSKERFDKDMNKLRNGMSDFDPREVIKKVKNQLTKYHTTFNISQNRVFVLLPSMKLVHRKKSILTVEDYRTQFARSSGLPKDNLILLSNNALLDMSESPPRSEYQVTNNFEYFIEKLTKISLKKNAARHFG